MPLYKEFETVIVNHALCHQSWLNLKLTAANIAHATILNHNTVLSHQRKKYKHVLCNGNKISSIADGRNCKVPYVLAKPPMTTQLDDIRPAQIEYFICHSTPIDSQSLVTNPSPILLSHVFAVCK